MLVPAFPSSGTSALFTLFLPSADLLEAAFFICSYELSIKSVHSPWCFLFSEEDAKVGASVGPTSLSRTGTSPGVCTGAGVPDGPEAVLETLSWSHDQQPVQLSSVSSHLQDPGQGRTSSQVGTLHIAFVAADTDVPSFRSTEELPEPASILVGHAETLLPLLSLLGLYKDQTPPTASNYHTQQGKMGWTRPLRGQVRSIPSRGTASKGTDHMTRAQPIRPLLIHHHHQSSFCGSFHYVQKGLRRSEKTETGRLRQLGV